MNRRGFENRFKIEADQMDLDVHVLSEGPLNAEVAFIGEGPGEQELKAGRPFVGGSGKLLWNTRKFPGICDKYDLPRRHVYITNVVKRQISLSSKGNARHAVTRPELSKWIALLHWELCQLPNLRYICVMGNFALEAVTNESKITRHRGSAYQVEVNGRNVQVVCTFNPAHVMRPENLRFEPIVMLDIKKLWRVMNGKYKRHDVLAHINPSLKEAYGFMDHLAHDGKPVCIDIETLSNEVACIGMGNDPHEAMCINFRVADINRFGLKDEVKLWRKMQSFINLINEGPGFVGQNAMFDAYYMWWKARLYARFSYDTLLAHHTLYPALPHGLDFLVAQYTDHPFYKDQGQLWKEGGNINEFWIYNCKDVALTIAVKEKIDLEWRDGLEDFFYNHVMRLQPHCVEATVHGIEVDKELKEELGEQIGEDVAKTRAEFYWYAQQLTGDDSYCPNPNSPKQLGELFFRKLRLVGRGSSTDKLNRTKMISNPKTPPMAKEMLTTLNHYKEEDKFLSTYVNSGVDEDGRIRCEYKQFGTQSAPGRLSSSQTADRTGMNLQNQPKRAYEMFLADPGCKFIYFDKAQAEAQVVAYRANIPKWKEQFARAAIDGSYDCHRALAADMWKMNYDDVPKEDKTPDGKPTKRFTSKRCRHGLNYRMQQERLADVTGLPYYSARKAFVLYHATTPELKDWWKQEEDNVRKKRVIFNAYGRRWKVLQRINDDVLKSIIAFYPQSTIGDHVCRIWYMAEEDAKWPIGKARIALNNHDALIAMAEYDYVDQCIDVLRKHAEEPIMITDVYGASTEKLVIPNEWKVSEPDHMGYHRWSGLKDLSS